MYHESISEEKNVDETPCRDGYGCGRGVNKCRMEDDDDERDERGRGRSGARAQAEAAKVSAGQKADNVPKRVVRHVTTKRSRTVQAPKRSTVWALGKPLE